MENYLKYSDTFFVVSVSEFYVLMIYFKYSTHNENEIKNINKRKKYENLSILAMLKGILTLPS